MKKIRTRVAVQVIGVVLSFIVTARGVYTSDFWVMLAGIAIAFIVMSLYDKDKE